MGDIVYIKEDLVAVKRSDSGAKVVLAFGDPVEVVGYDKTTKRTTVRVRGRGPKPFTGTVRGKLPTMKEGVLQFSMVDVQQGDGMIIETPKGRKLFVDGGDNKLFARYTAARYPNTSHENPLEVDAMIVTHGDADHFAGLTEIHKSESETGKRARKALFIHPRRVYHNGLVKGPSNLKPEKIFGTTAATRDGRAIVDLEDDLLKVPAARLNSPFKRWIKALRHWEKRGPIEFRRLQYGDKTAFDFLEDEGITVDVHGPITTTAKYRGKRRKALALLRQPKKAVEIHLEDEPDTTRAFSASHTVNGHSVTFRLNYGNVRFYLTGDLNQESMFLLRKKLKPGDFESEIIKAPHHGSADFDLKALKMMKPTVSLISSGDESSRKEHIHPRATLMGALGKVARGNTSLVFCTELAAFFAMRGWSKEVKPANAKRKKSFFGFERTNFGIIQIRTDGTRVLVFTHSGREGMKEAYRFTVDRKHNIRFASDITKR